MQFTAATGRETRETGRNQIGPVRLDRNAFGSLRDRHGRVARQKPSHQADVDRIEMLNDDKGHAGVRRQCGQQSLEGVEAAGRRADTRNRNPVCRR